MLRTVPPPARSYDHLAGRQVGERAEQLSSPSYGYIANGPCGNERRTLKIFQASPAVTEAENGRKAEKELPQISFLACERSGRFAEVRRFERVVHAQDREPRQGQVSSTL